MASRFFRLTRRKSAGILDVFQTFSAQSGGKRCCQTVRRDLISVSLEHHWYRNARKESWTPELRQAASEYRRDRDTGWKCYHTFTHFIKCGRCGANYRCQTHKRVDGTVVRSWYCSSPTAVGCSKVGIREDTLRTLIAEVMGLPEFNEERFNLLTVGAVVKGDGSVLADGDAADLVGAAWNAEVFLFAAEESGDVVRQPFPFAACYVVRMVMLLIILALALLVFW